MNAAAEYRDIIEQAARDGLAFARGTAPGKLKLSGPTDAIRKWKPIIAQHKANILPLIEASNDEGRPLPGVIVPAADPLDDGLTALLAAHGDGSAQGVDWSAWRLTTATSSATWAVVNPRGLTLLFTVEPIPKPRSYPLAWPVERIAPWPDVEGNAEEFAEDAGIIEAAAQLMRAGMR